VNAIPDEVRGVIDGLPRIGEFDQAFLLLTVDPVGQVDVCLLSRTEVDTSISGLRLVVSSTKARRNLHALGRATLVVVTGNAVHYLALELRGFVEDDGAMGADLELVRDLRDDIGVELEPMRFRLDKRLQDDENWGRTNDLLAQLAGDG